VVAKVRLSESKQAGKKFYMERFNLEKLNNVEVKEQYQIKISNRFAALEEEEEEEEEKRTSIGLEKLLAHESFSHRKSRLYEMKQHKPRSDEECSRLLDERKKDKLKWLQNPSQTNGDNLNNMRL
jgi:hypothetical protein